MPNNAAAQEWLNLALHDLDAAKTLFEANHFNDTISFLLQQSIEKSQNLFWLSKIRKSAKHMIQQNCIQSLIMNYLFQKRTQISLISLPLIIQTIDIPIRIIHCRKMRRFKKSQIPLELSMEKSKRFVLGSFSYHFRNPLHAICSWKISPRITT